MRKYDNMNSLTLKSEYSDEYSEIVSNINPDEFNVSNLISFNQPNLNNENLEKTIKNNNESIENIIQGLNRIKTEDDKQEFKNTKRIKNKKLKLSNANSDLDIPDQKKNTNKNLGKLIGSVKNNLLKNSESKKGNSDWSGNNLVNNSNKSNNLNKLRTLSKNSKSASKNKNMSNPYSSKHKNPNLLSPRGLVNNKPSLNSMSINTNLTNNLSSTQSGFKNGSDIKMSLINNIETFSKDKLKSTNNLDKLDTHPKNREFSDETSIITNEIPNLRKESSEINPFTHNILEKIESSASLFKNNNYSTNTNPFSPSTSSQSKKKRI
jgi:hypothetical protein